MVTKYKKNLIMYMNKRSDWHPNLIFVSAWSRRRNIRIPTNWTKVFSLWNKLTFSSHYSAVGLQYMLTRIYKNAAFLLVTSEKIRQSTEATSKKPTHFCTSYKVWHEAEFLGEIQTKVLLVFFLAIHSHLYSFALKVGTSERVGGSGRWQMFEIVLGPWWSMFFPFLILSPSLNKSISFSALLQLIE